MANYYYTIRNTNSRDTTASCTLSCPVGFNSSDDNISMTRMTSQITTNIIYANLQNPEYFDLNIL